MLSSGSFARPGRRAFLLPFIPHNHPVLLLCVFLVLLSACSTAPPATEPYEIGIIIPLSPFEVILDGFNGGLQDNGLQEGEDYTILYDGAISDPDEIEARVQAYVDNDVDLILSVGTPATLIVKDVTAESGIPVVFGVTDAVSTGIVNNPLQPEGNLTGVETAFSEAPRFEWLHRIVLEMETVYVPYNPGDGSAVSALSEVQPVANKLGVTLITQEITTADALTEALENLPADVDAIFVLPDALMGSKMDQFTETALARQLPLCLASAQRDEISGLMTYGFQMSDTGHQMSNLAERLLAGANPADVPVELVEFHLGINVHFAEQIGLDIPEDILGAADTIDYD
jgi:putative ABC transport system substrate-binding protein